MDFFPDFTISLFSPLKCKFEKIYLFILSWVPACVSVHSVHEGQKRKEILLKLELPIVVSCDEGADQTLLLGKNSQCS